jgi:hypothetical protein
MIHTTTKKAADATNANGLHTTSTGADFLTGGAIRQAPNDSDIAAEIARLMLAGHAVYKGNAKDFTVCKYGLAKHCKNFNELQAFAKQVGACL